MPDRLAASRAIALTTLWIVPLVVVPPLESPFSAPKLWCIAGATLLTLLLAAPFRRPWPESMTWVALAWAASCAWSGLTAPDVQSRALLGALAGPAWWAAVVQSGMSPAQGIRALAWSGFAVAVIALWQAAGVDPFAWLGWEPRTDGNSARLRVYGTLGNPNFVGAWLAMLAPLVAAVWMDTPAGRRRVATASLLPAILGAIAVTGSRGAALGLGVGLVALLHLARARRRWWLTAACVALVLALAAASAARPLATTLEGRAYIWRTVLPHVLAHPVTGWGLGAIGLRYTSWETEAHRGANLSQFSGPQQHLHNDFLQALAERGVPGLVTIVLLFATVVRVTSRHPRWPDTTTLPAGAAASVVAAAALALVDFPLQRPVEVMTLWTAAALATAASRGSPDDAA